MNQTAIFWPMIAHVVLIMIIYVMMFRARVSAVKAGHAKVSQFRQNQVEPDESLFIKNSLTNQFELPMLFYAVCLTLYVTNGASLVPLVLAWIFALLRYLHAYIHVTSNRIRYRQPAFSLGLLVLALMWLWLALHLLGLA